MNTKTWLMTVIYDNSCHTALSQIPEDLLGLKTVKKSHPFGKSHPSDALVKRADARCTLSAFESCLLLAGWVTPGQLLILSCLGSLINAFIVQCLACGVSCENTSQCVASPSHSTWPVAGSLCWFLPGGPVFYFICRYPLDRAWSAVRERIQRGKDRVSRIVCSIIVGGSCA